MARPRKKKTPSLIRRLAYLLMLLSGGGAGVGGLVFKDHPRVQALWALVTGKPAGEPIDPDLEGSVADAVAGLLQPTDPFDRPGTYQVTISQVHLDPNLFRAGHTVDIQAKVLKHDGQGRSSTLWDTSSFGEQLAVAGRDELVAEWEHRPFQVQWSPGEQLTVEVYDRRAGLFAQPRRFLLAAPDPEPREFPLKPGTFPLEPESQKPDPRVDPRNVKIVLQSRRVGDLPSQDRERGPVREPDRTPAQARAQSPSRSPSRAQDDDSPIVIK